MSTEHDPPDGSPPKTEPTPTEPEPTTPHGAIGRPFPDTPPLEVAPPAPSDTLEPLPDATADTSLAPTAADAALLDAVGAPARKRARRPSRTDEVGDDAGTPGKSRKTLLVVVLALVVGGVIATFALLGRVNAQRYMLACTTTQAVAEQGRGFPPWGEQPLTGAEWRPIALPPDAQCKPRELDNREQLEGVFLEMLLERASATLARRDLLELPPAARGAQGPLELVAAQLEQALLLSRAPERGDQRKQVERLLGDIQYWRASLRLRDASAALGEAAKQFDAAALQRPMHVTDAGAWAEFLRRITDELRAGPTGIAAPLPPAGNGERPPAPMGSALPVEPDEPQPAAEPAPTPPDAGVPTGGVLL